LRSPSTAPRVERIFSARCAGVWARAGPERVASGWPHSGQNFADGGGR
jgi:hypothetical protein